MIVGWQPTSVMRQKLMDGRSLSRRLFTACRRSWLTQGCDRQRGKALRRGLPGSATDGIDLAEHMSRNVDSAFSDAHLCTGGGNTARSLRADVGLGVGESPLGRGGAPPLCGRTGSGRCTPDNCQCLFSSISVGIDWERQCLFIGGLVASSSESDDWSTPWLSKLSFDFLCGERLGWNEISFTAAGLGGEFWVPAKRKHTD